MTKLDGITTLQVEITILLQRADIDEATISSIMELIAQGETKRQDLEDARIIDQLAKMQP